MSGVHSAWSYPAPPPRQRNYRPSPFQNQVPSHDQYPSRNWSSMFQDPALPMGPIPRRQPSWTITGDQASSEREASTSIKSEAETAILEEEDAGGWVSGFPQRDKWARQPVPTNQPSLRDQTTYRTAPLVEKNLVVLPKQTQADSAQIANIADHGPYRPRRSRPPSPISPTVETHYRPESSSSPPSQPFSRRSQQPPLSSDDISVSISTEGIDPSSYAAVLQKPAITSSTRASPPPSDKVSFGLSVEPQNEPLEDPSQKEEAEDGLCSKEERLPTPPPAEPVLASAGTDERYPVVLPTYRGHHQQYHLPPHIRQAALNDPNRLEAGRHRQWGPSVKSVIESDSEPTAPVHSPPDGGWAMDTVPHKSVEQKEKAVLLRDWANKVLPISPPVMSSDHQRTSVLSASSRPDSTVPTVKPTTIYYSGGEGSIASLDLVTPMHHTLPARPPPQQEMPVMRENHHTASTADTNYNGNKVESRGPYGREESQRRFSRDTRESFDHQLDRPAAMRIPSSQGGSESQWWKPPPHPMFSPKWASRKLLVSSVVSSSSPRIQLTMQTSSFEFPLRLDHVRDAMLHHFSRYGRVRDAWDYEANGDSCEKAFVVFEDEDSLIKCFADPERNQCLFRSSARVAATRFRIDIKQLPPHSATRTIFVRVSGLRFNERSRSASPTGDRPPTKEINDNATTERNGRVPRKLRRLPPKLLIYAAPATSRFGSFHWSVRILRPGDKWEDIRDRFKRSTQREAVILDEIDLARRVPESSFVPRLCDYFGEVYDIFPPTRKGQGWLITIADPDEARNLLDTLNNVSGLTARWADERDGHYQHQRPLQQQAILGSDLSAVNRLQKSLASPSSPSSNSEDPGESPTATTVAVASGPLLTPISRSPLLDLQPQLTPPATVIDQAEQPRSSSADHPPHTDQANQPSDISPIHPYLRRAVLSVYRGRALKEESSSSGERKYVDEAAVFVGRLVKTAETKESLLQRFERYGKICEIEYNPHVVSTTYATARVLYQTADAAQRAIHFENNAVSFGSAIKADIRKVLPMDIQMRDMFIDVLGRAISPSHASQYSPPSDHSDVIWAPPPPLVPFMQGQMVYSPFQPQDASGGPHPTAPTAPVWYLPTPPDISNTPPGTGLSRQTASVHFAASPPNTALGFVPMLLAHGISLYPPPLYGQGVTQLPPTAQPQTAPQIPPDVHNTSLGTTVMPDMSVSTPPDRALSSAVKYENVTTPLDTPNSPPPAESEIPSRRKSSPRIVGQKFKDGVLKIIYDPDDLKRYRDECGLPQLEPKDKDKLNDATSLLPIASGGEENHQADPNQSFASSSSEKVNASNEPKAIQPTDMSSDEERRHRSAPPPSEDSIPHAWDQYPLDHGSDERNLPSGEQLRRPTQQFDRSSQPRSYRSRDRFEAPRQRVAIERKIGDNVNSMMRRDAEDRFQSQEQEAKAAKARKDEAARAGR